MTPKIGRLFRDRAGQTQLIELQTVLYILNEAGCYAITVATTREKDPETQRSAGRRQGYKILEPCGSACALTKFIHRYHMVTPLSDTICNPVKEYEKNGIHLSLTSDCMAIAKGGSLSQCHHVRIGTHSHMAACTKLWPPILQPTGFQ